MENLHSYRCTAEQNRLYLPYYHDLCSLWRKGTVPPMKGRMKPYLPELTIRDYNIYLQYLRGVRRQLYTEFGWYSCHLLRYNGVVFAILSDSLAGRTATCQRQRVPGTLCWRRMMCQTQGIRQAAQVEVLLGWHNLQDRRPDELRPANGCAARWTGFCCAVPTSGPCSRTRPWNACSGRSGTRPWCR